MLIEVSVGKILENLGKLGFWFAFTEKTGRGKVVICNEWLGSKWVIRFFAYESIHNFNDTIHYESMHFDSETEVNRFKKKKFMNAHFEILTQQRERASKKILNKIK